MASVTYRPGQEPGDDFPLKTSQYGYDFVANQPVEVTNGLHLMKFTGNPYFEVGDEAPDAKPTGLRAVHRGRGSYSVMSGDMDTEVLGELTKADAEAFNALSEEDKAAYVETAKAPVEPVETA